MAEHVEMIAKALYELDRQKGLQSHHWLTEAEAKRNAYRSVASASQQSCSGSWGPSGTRGDNLDPIPNEP